MLDASMNFSDSTSCENLCLMEKDNGCCYLQSGWGCYWKSGGYSDAVVSDGGISVTCSTAGIEQTIFVEKGAPCGQNQAARHFFGCQITTKKIILV